MQKFLILRARETPVSPGSRIPLRSVLKALRSRERNLSREMRERSPNGLPSAGHWRRMLDAVLLNRLGCRVPRVCHSAEGVSHGGRIVKRVVLSTLEKGGHHLEGINAGTKKETCVFRDKKEHPAQSVKAAP